MIMFPKKSGDWCGTMNRFEKFTLHCDGVKQRIRWRKL